MSTNLGKQLLLAIDKNDRSSVENLLKQGASSNTRDAESGLSALMMAAGHGNPEIVKLLLDAGADVFAVDSRAGSSTLHKAIQGGNLQTVQMLAEAGAFVDWPASTTGHTPLMDALWFKWPHIVQYLLGRGAGLNLSTHYGFTMRQHFEYELNVNVIDKEKLLAAEKMLKARDQADKGKIETQKLMAAVNNNDVEEVEKLIAAGVNVDERYPFVNGFNDAHTPLLVACRDGHTEIVAALLNADADVNAVEPTFGAVPLHKSVYNGHVEITRMLVQRPGIDIDFQGSTNGYSPLHDALWHGYTECAETLIEAGARLDTKGHDGKLPVDIAIDVYGPDHEVVKLIRSKMGKE